MNSDGKVLAVFKADAELTCLHNEDLADIRDLVIPEGHIHYQILNIFRERAAAVIQMRRQAAYNVIKRQNR